MKVSATVDSAAVRARLGRLRAAVASPVVGEVYFATSEAARLMRFHASGEPRSKIPLRNPLFVDEGTRDRVLGQLRRGIDALAAGKESSLEPAMGKAAALVAERMRRNIAPRGSPIGGQRGRSAPAGTSVADGTPMAPLSAEYRARKLKKHGKRAILVATGATYDAIQSRVKRV